MKKIAFIGMMGCGKSSIANDISKDLALKLISIDKMVEKELNLSISDIFEKFGEPYFRKIETKVLKNAVINESCIIDCGGGIILDSSNIEILKNNGYSIIFIDRNPESPYVKDSYRVVVRKWLTKEQVLNIYGKELSSKDKSDIDDNWKDAFSTSTYYIRSFENGNGTPMTDGL